MKQCTESINMVVVGMFVILVLSSCQKKTEDARSTKKYATLENLQTAYKAEIRQCRWYTRFSHQAQEDRHTNVISLFKATARLEKIHADNDASQIRAMSAEPRVPLNDSISPGVTHQALKLTLSTERFECESLYPIMIQTAEAEKLHEIARQFSQTKNVDSPHKELFKEAVDFSGNISRVNNRVCPVCGYIVTSVTTGLCPICSTSNEKFEKI